MQATVRRAVKEGLLSSAHDCSDGGLAVALAECCMMAAPPPGGGPTGWLGAAVRVPFPIRKDLVLFGESASRIVVSLPPSALARLEALAGEEGAPVVRLGAVGGERLDVQGALSVEVAALGQAWREALPAIARRDGASAVTPEKGTPASG